MDCAGRRRGRGRRGEKARREDAGGNGEKAEPKAEMRQSAPLELARCAGKDARGSARAR